MFILNKHGLERNVFDFVSGNGGSYIREKWYSSIAAEIKRDELTDFDKIQLLPLETIE